MDTGFAPAPHRRNRVAPPPDHLAGPRRWAGVVLIALVAVGYLVPVGYPTVQALLGQPPFPGADPWSIVVRYLAALPLFAGVALAAGNLRITERRRSWRRLAFATACCALGFAAFLLAAS